MDDQELRKLLDQLHKEIEQADTLDDKGRELLKDIGEDIRTLLERAESGEDSMEMSTVERLEESIDHFEISHPTLTMTLSRLLDILSNSGI